MLGPAPGSTLGTATAKSYQADLGRVLNSFASTLEMQIAWHLQSLNLLGLPLMVQARRHEDGHDHRHQEQVADGKFHGAHLHSGCRSAFGNAMRSSSSGSRSGSPDVLDSRKVGASTRNGMPSHDHEQVQSERRE